MNALRAQIAANAILSASLVAFVVLATVYSFVTKLKYGPDEPAHFIYLRSIAVDFALPAISHVETKQESYSATHEAHQPPLYYALMAIPYAFLALAGLSGESVWRVLRLLNIPLGVFYVSAVYALAFEFFGDKRRAALAAAFVALIPTSSYTFAVVNNENLISPLFTAALIPVLRYFKSGLIARRSAVVTGALIGLAAISKAQGLALVPLFLLAALAVCRREYYGNWRRVSTDAAIVLATACVAGGWWYARNYALLGALMPQSLHNPVFPHGWVQAAVEPTAFLVVTFGATCMTYGYFWTPFWLIREFVPFLNYLYALAALTAAAAVGVVMGLRRLNTPDRRSVGFLAAAPVTVYLLWLSHAVFVDMGANMQGRLFLSTAGVAGLLFVIGAEGLARSERARCALAAIVLAALALANAGVIACAAVMCSGTS